MTEGMRVELPGEGIEFGRGLAAALRKAGGVDLARAAHRDPGSRESVVLPILEGSGVLELDARDGLDELTAIAAACRAAGSVALPYPLAGRLAGALADAPGVAVVSAEAPAADHADLMTGWTAITPEGSRAAIAGPAATRSAVSSRFAGGLVVGPWSAGDPAPAVLLMLLQGWSVLGSLDHALSLTIRHSRDRVQFGHPISEYQGIQFQLADAFVELSALEVTCEDALSAYAANAASAVVDVLALRVATLEAAQKVLGVCHQVHGAIGFTDEHDLSWLTRYGHLVRRSPLGASGTLALLTAEIERGGFRSLFPVPAYSGAANG